MTSSSITGNFTVLKPTTLKYKDDEVVRLDNEDEVLYLEDPHLTQDFNALAKLQTKHTVRLQEFSGETVADFDENLLTNANFKSISKNDNRSLTNLHFNTISTDSGNETSESAFKSRKYKNPQLDDSIAKRTRSKLKESTPSSSACNTLSKHQRCESFKTNSSPVIKCKISYQKCRKNKRTDKRYVHTNKTVLSVSQLEKKCLDLQFNTSTNSELGKPIPNEKNGTCTSLDFNTNTDLNKTVQNCKQSEEFSNMSKSLPCGESQTHNENTDLSTDVNSTLSKTFQNYKQLDIIPNVLDNVKETYNPSFENIEFITKPILPFENFNQSELTVVNIIYQLDEFERMVNDFKGVVISELNTRGTDSKLPTKKEMSAISSSKNEDKYANHEELFISEMENEFKQQFSINDHIHDEEGATFSTGMPKWEKILNKYKNQI